MPDFSHNLLKDGPHPQEMAIQILKSPKHKRKPRDFAQWPQGWNGTPHGCESRGTVIHLLPFSRMEALQKLMSA